MQTFDKDPLVSHHPVMRALTIKDAKAHLGELIDAATAGEDVVLMRGSTHVAAIVPLTADDIELRPRITDQQAGRLWQALAAERAAGRGIELASPKAAAEHLRGLGARRARPAGDSSPVRARGRAKQSVR